jgi:hypothetical protein
MKKLASFMISAVVLSISQMAVADVKHEKVTRSDRVSFYKTDAKATQKAERVQRTDRVAFYPQQVEQPSLQQKRVVRTDRVVFNKS